MTPRNAQSRNEVADHLAALYDRATPVGAEIWVRPDTTTSLRKFQIVAAAAQALERLGRIKIVETRKAGEGGVQLIERLRIRRLR